MQTPANYKGSGFTLIGKNKVVKSTKCSGNLKKFVS